MLPLHHWATLLSMSFNIQVFKKNASGLFQKKQKKSELILIKVNAQAKKIGSSALFTIDEGKTEKNQR